MVVDLNKVAIQVAELKKDLDALTDKASSIFELIGDDEERVDYYAPFDDGINAAEAALSKAAKRVQEEAIIKLSNEE